MGCVSAQDKPKYYNNNKRVSNDSNEPARTEVKQTPKSKDTRIDGQTGPNNLDK